MNKESISSYGWVIVTLIILSLLIVASTPFGRQAIAEIQKIPDKIAMSFGTGDSGENDVAGGASTQKLDTPTNLNVSSENVLTYDPVNYADVYVITIKNGNVSVLMTVYTTEVDLSNELKNINDQAIIGVVAKNSNKLFADSDKAIYVISRTLEAPTSISLQSNYTLKWAEVENADGYVVVVDGGTPIYSDTNSVSVKSEVKGKTGTVNFTVKATDSSGVYNDSPEATKSVALSRTVTYISQGKVIDTATVSTVSYLPFEWATVTLLEAPTRSGYTFLGWKNGSTTYEAGQTITIYRDMTFTAQWDEITSYTVTFMSDGKVVDTQTTTGSVTMPAAPTKVGYTFKGWSDGTNTYSAGETTTVSADTTFTAQWEAVKYSIIYNANGGTFDSGESTLIENKVYAEAYYITSDKPTRSGYTFLGWSIDGGSNIVFSEATEVLKYALDCVNYMQSGDCYNENKEMTLYAIWQENEYGDAGLYVEQNTTSGTRRIVYPWVVLERDGWMQYTTGYERTEDDYYTLALYSLSYNAEGFGVNLNDDIQARLYGSGEASTCLKMPNSKTRPIAKIEDYSFQNCDTFNRIDLPETLIHIGNYAFYNCSELNTVYFPLNFNSKYNDSNVYDFDSDSFIYNSIGDYAFAGCTSLTTQVQGYNDKIYYDCIPEVREIGYKAFESCPSALFTFESNIWYLKSPSSDYYALYIVKKVSKRRE